MAKRISETLDCACVIHGDKYSWEYVERLYNMIAANTRYKIRMHVFTEPHRSVPDNMIKHELIEWPGISGPKKSWWYKMQMFDPKHQLKKVLYFDLDVVIVDNIDWLWDLSDQYFWAIRDFKYLWRPEWNGINSSVMLWNNVKLNWIWDSFSSKNINATVRLFHGDQDYLNSILDDKTRRFLNTDFVKSWRWQCLDGGFDIKSRAYQNPNAGTSIFPCTKIMIFHGNPKPHEIQDPVVHKYWKVNYINNFIGDSNDSQNF
jgi:hypothetical protein